MGILTIVPRPVYRTTDGEEFANPAEAEKHQLRITLEQMMSDTRFRPSPGPAGNWTWSTVKEFITDNREELRILLENVQPKNANDAQ